MGANDNQVNSMHCCKGKRKTTRSHCNQNRSSRYRETIDLQPLENCLIENRETHRHGLMAFLCKAHTWCFRIEGKQFLTHSGKPWKGSLSQLRLGNVHTVRQWGGVQVLATEEQAMVATINRSKSINYISLNTHIPMNLSNEPIHQRLFQISGTSNWPKSASVNGENGQTSPGKGRHWHNWAPVWPTDKCSSSSQYQAPMAQWTAWGNDNDSKLNYSNM